MKFLKYALGIIFLFLFLAIFTGYAYLRSTFPKTSGTISVNELSERVEVIRDRWDLPHIFAQNKRDLFYSVGYVMAQDRLFQMDFLRRIGGVFSWTVKREENACGTLTLISKGMH